MTTYYLDANAGSDANDGLTLATAKRTPDSVAFSASNVIYFVRGGYYPVNSTYKDIGNGVSLLAYGAYGGNPVLRNPSGTGGMIFNASGSGRSGILIDGLDFDCSTDSGSLNGAIYFASQGAGNCVSNTIRASRFYGGAGNGFVASYETSASGVVSDFLLERCDFFNNAGHGLMMMGLRHRVYKCRAWNNGAGTNPNGGHGMSFLYARTTASNTWVNVSGNVYSFTLPSNQTSVDYVRIASGPAATTYSRLTKNVSTPTTPAAGEFGVSGTTLYINMGAGQNPNSGYTNAISYAWGKTDSILLRECEAWGNYYNPLTPFYEGHGFAFDDFTQNSSMLRCSSHDNDGVGISINQGSGNRVISSDFYNNKLAGVGASGNNTTIQNNTLVNNNLGGYGKTSGADFWITGLADNSVIRNNVAVGNGVTANGVDSPNFASSRSSMTVDHNAMSGYLGRVASGITETAALSGDFKLSPTRRPRSGSPLIGGGLDLGYVRTYGGRQVRRLVGAHGPASLRSALV